MSGQVDVLAWIDGVVSGSESLDRASGIWPSSQTTCARNARAAVAELIEASRAYFSGYCVDEADDWVDEGEHAGECTGCTQEQIDAAKRLRAALANVGSAS